MIIGIFAITLIVAFIVADAAIDYVFGAIYALAITGAANSLIRVIKYHKKHGNIYTEAIGSIFLYLLMGTGAYVIWWFYFA